MLDRYRIYKIELSFIYLLSALLVISLSGLGVHAVAANKSMDSGEKYPDLMVENAAEIVPASQKTVYFTFDDGPSHNTEAILDMLSTENVKATFFVCAQCSDDVDAPAVLKRILAEGHEIGLHSYTRDYCKIYKSFDDYFEDLSAINDYIIEATGYRASIVRFPGGSGTCNASPALIKKIKAELTRRGYRYYDWDVESGDQTVKVNSAGFIADKMVNGTKDRHRVIMLLHDSPKPKTSCEAVKLAIPRLREQGYTFDKLTACVDNEHHYS